MSWYQKGVDEESLKQAEKESSSGQRRLWMPVDSSKRIVFLDDEPFCFYEHNPKINGEYKNNWFTCRKGLDKDGCPMCASKIRRYYIGLLTVLDLDGFVSKKDGKTYKNFRQLLPMKIDTLKRFKTIKQRKTSLVGAVYAFARSGERSPTCGDVWDFEEYIDLDKSEYWYESKLEGKLKKPEPYNYLDMFAPLTAKEMMSIGVGGGSSSDDDSYSGKAESGGEDSDALY